MYTLSTDIYILIILTHIHILSKNCIWPIKKEEFNGIEFDEKSFITYGISDSNNIRQLQSGIKGDTMAHANKCRNIFYHFVYAKLNIQLMNVYYGKEYFICYKGKMLY